VTKAWPLTLSELRHGLGYTAKAWPRGYSIIRLTLTLEFELIAVSYNPKWTKAWPNVPMPQCRLAAGTALGQSHSIIGRRLGELKFYWN